MNHTDSEHYNRERAFSLELENARLSKDLSHILSSRSWRWTSPIRTAQSNVKKMWYILKGKRRKILFIDDHLPFINRDSGSVRLFGFLQILAGMKNDITFIPFNLEDDQEASMNLHKLGIRVLCRDHINSISAHLQAEGSSYDIIVACRMPCVYEYIADLQRYAPQAKIIFDTVDLHFLRLKRQTEIHPEDPLRSQVFLWEQREINLMKHAHCTIVVSEDEQSLIKNKAPDVPVFVISNIHNIHAKPVWDEHRKNILFLGNFNHEPNVDAVRHLVETIMPLVRRTMPDVVLEIAGDYSAGSIEDLAANNVRLLGHVEDLTTAFTRARVLAAPLRFGAGVKGKLHMSMAYGVPFVTTSIGAEGMHIHHGESAFIADEPQAFAECILRLYEDKTLWVNMAASSQAILRKRFSPQAAATEIKRMFAFLDRR